RHSPSPSARLIFDAYPSPLRGRVREGGRRWSTLKTRQKSAEIKLPPCRSASRIDLPLKGGGEFRAPRSDEPRGGRTVPIPSAQARARRARRRAKQAVQSR